MQGFDLNLNAVIAVFECARCFKDECGIKRAAFSIDR